MNQSQEKLPFRITCALLIAIAFMSIARIFSIIADRFMRIAEPYVMSEEETKDYADRMVELARKGEKL